MTKETRGQLERDF